MGEKINLDKPEKQVILLDPTSDECWDNLLDEVRLTGSALYEYEGQTYELTVEDLDGPEAA